jgi:glutamate/tyrosine decarboxylase-like PLP-dependent enzyme
MIARLFNAPSHDEANTIGTSTIGSSEAIMVGHSCGTETKRQLTYCSWQCSP